MSITLSYKSGSNANKNDCADGGGDGGNGDVYKDDDDAVDHDDCDSISTFFVCFFTADDECAVPKFS